MAETRDISVAKALLGFAALFVLIPLPWALATAYVANTGIAADAVVTGKREAIVVSGGDAWARIREVTYRYQPLDEHYPQTDSQQVDEALFTTLRVGSHVRVRYSPWRPLRFVKNWGAFLDGSSAIARLGFGLEAMREASEGAEFVLGILLGWLAFRLKSKVLAVLAALVAGAAVPGALLAMVAIGLPSLLWLWCKPAQGNAVLLMAALIISAGIVYWRIPQSPRLPPGPLRTTNAIARQVHVVSQIWTSLPHENGGESGGQAIGHPFDLVDLEFTPEGMADPVHAVTYVDVGSVPGLQPGGVVPITYAVQDPHIAQIPGATETYVQQTMISLAELTGAIAFVVVLVLWTSRVVRSAFFSRYQDLTARVPPAVIKERLSRVPVGDPRRKALEKYLQRVKSGLEGKGTRTEAAPNGRQHSIFDSKH